MRTCKCSQSWRLRVVSKCSGANCTHSFCYFATWRFSLYCTKSLFINYSYHYKLFRVLFRFTHSRENKRRTQHFYCLHLAPAHYTPVCLESLLFFISIRSPFLTTFREYTISRTHQNVIPTKNIRRLCNGKRMEGGNRNRKDQHLIQSEKKRKKKND